MPQQMDERPLFTGLLVLFPAAFLEWLYYTYLVWPFLVTKQASLGRFHFGWTSKRGQASDNTAGIWRTGLGHL